MSKEIAKLSLGVYSSLKEIEFTQNLNKINPRLRYYYLQGWNGVNHKLSYKANYKPIEFCSPCHTPYWVDSIDVPYIETGFKLPVDDLKIPPDLCKLPSTQPDLTPESEHIYKAIDIDRPYMMEAYQTTIDGRSVKVFINGEIMTSKELCERYKVYSETCNHIYQNLEELALSVGYPLCHQLLVVFKFSEHLVT